MHIFMGQTKMKTNFWVITAVASLLWCGCQSSNVAKTEWKSSIRQGEAARAKGDWMGADMNFTRALAEIQKVETNSPRVITTLDDLAEARTALRQYAEAEQFLQQRLRAGQAIGWTNTVEYMIALENLADVMAFQKKYSEAEQSYLSAEALMEYKYSRMNPAFGLLQAKHAKLYLLEHRLDEADAMYSKAKGNLEFLERSLNPTSYQRSFTVVQLGGVLNDYGLLKLETKEWAEAEKLFRKSVSELESQFGHSSLNLVTPLNNLAVAYARQGKFDEGEKAAGRSLAILNKAGTAGQPGVAQTQRILSAIQQKQIP